MKGLVFLLLFLVMAWRWRTWREAQAPKRVPPQPAAPKTIDTLACRQCGLHVPHADAIQGAQGAYCCIAHRALLEP